MIHTRQEGSSTPKMTSLHQPPVDQGKGHPIEATDIVSYVFGGAEEYDLDKPIFVDAQNPSQPISARAARNLVEKLVGGFQEQGLEEGDCVCVHSYNIAVYPLLYLGAIGAGGCVSGSNPAYTVPEIVHHFKITSAKFIVAQISSLPSIVQAAQNCHIPPTRIFFIGESNQPLPHGCQSWKALLSHQESTWRSFGKDLVKSGNTIAALSATSGTTGLPKAAAISHRFLVAQCTMIQQHSAGREYPVSRLICLPMFHAFAAPVAMLLPLRQGTTTYLLPRFELQQFADSIQAYSITEVFVVPPIIKALLRMSPSQHNLLHSLQYMVCAGAYMSADAQSRLYAQLSPTTVIAQCWGTTETGWTTAFNSAEKDTSGSVGRLLPNVELKIIAADGQKVVQEGGRGEAWIRSASTFNAYRGNEEANAKAFDRDGFYRTGDEVYVVDGKVFLCGRAKEIIKVRGWQVSPAELEDVILQHPGVEDAAVSGVTRYSKEGIEETFPRAFVVQTGKAKRRGDSGKDAGPVESPTSSDAREITAEEVQDFVASRLVSYKHLTGGVIFVDKIPRSNTGKILRRILDQIPADASPELVATIIQQASSSESQQDNHK